MTRDYQAEAESHGLVALFVLAPFDVFYPGETVSLPPEKAKGLVASGKACLWQDRDQTPAEAPVVEEAAPEGSGGGDAPKGAGVSLSTILKPKGA